MSPSSIAFSADGRLLAANSYPSGKGIVTIWSVRDRGLLRTFHLPSFASFVAWGFGDNTLTDGTRKLDPNVGEIVEHFFSPPASSLVAIPAAGPAAWLGFDRDAARLFGIDGKPLATLALPQGKSLPGYSEAKHARVSRNGQIAVSPAGADGLLVWDLATPSQPCRQVSIETGTNATDVAVDPEGKRAWLVVRRGTNGPSRIAEVDLTIGRVLRTLATLPDKNEPNVVATSDGVRVIADTLSDLVAWDSASGKEAWRVPINKILVTGRPLGVSALVASPVEPIVAASIGDGEVVLLDSRSGRFLGQLGPEVREPFAMLFSADGRSLLSLSSSYASRWSLDDARLDGAHLAIGVAAGARLGTGDFWVGRSPNPTFVPDFIRAWLPHTPAECSQKTIPIDLAPWSDAGALAGRPGESTRGLTLDAAALPSPNRCPLCLSSMWRLEALSISGRTGLATLGSDSHGLGVVSLVSGGLIPLADSELYLAGTLSLDGRYASGQSLDESVRVWNAESGSVRSTIKLEDLPWRTALSADGSLLAVISSKPIWGRDARGFQTYAPASDPGVVELFALPVGTRLWRKTFAAEMSAVAFSPQNDVIVGSHSGVVSVLRPEGVVGSFDGGDDGGVFSLAVSTDSRLLAVGHSDGAVRIWDMCTRALRATLINFQDDEWAITTPGGAFTGSEEVGTHLGWVFESPLERFSFDAFTAPVRDPSTVRRRLWTGTGDVAAPIQRPPKLALAAEPTRGPRNIQVRVRASSDARLDSVLAFRDGRLIQSLPLERTSGEMTLDVPILPGSNMVALTAVDEHGITSHPLTVEARGTSGPRPDLWLVSVGVDKYRYLPNDVQLRSASRDARAIADAFQRQAGSGRPFAKQHARVLLNDEVTPSSVLTGFSELQAMAPDDLAIVYLAGHGIKTGKDADMRFLTGEVRLNAASVRRDGVGWSEVADALALARGRVIVLLDACRSGHFTQESISANGALAARLSKQGRAGVVVLSAAKGRQSSIEDGQHGLFTRAILEGLDDPATDRNGNGQIELSELVDMVTARVDLLTHGQQTPWIARRELFGDFVVAASSTR